MLRALNEEGRGVWVRLCPLVDGAGELEGGAGPVEAESVSFLQAVRRSGAGRGHWPWSRRAWIAPLGRVWLGRPIHTLAESRACLAWCPTFEASRGLGPAGFQKNWFQIRKGVHQDYILSPCLFNLYAVFIMRNAGLDKAQAGIKISWRNIVQSAARWLPTTGSNVPRTGRPASPQPSQATSRSSPQWPPSEGTDTGP